MQAGPVSDYASRFEQPGCRANWLNLLALAAVGAVVWLAIPAAAGVWFDGVQHTVVQFKFWVWAGIMWCVLFAILATVMVAMLRGRRFWLVAGIIAGGAAVLLVVGALLDVLFGNKLALVVVAWLAGPPTCTVLASSLKPLRFVHESLRCRWCGYDLYGTSLETCPECGRSVTGGQRMEYRRTVESQETNAQGLDELAADTADHHGPTPSTNASGG